MKIIVFGDSHSRYLRVNQQVRAYAPWLKDWALEVHVVNGASIVGLGRKRSKLKVFELVAKEMDPGAINVFGFGQVDLELGYYYRKVIKGEEIELGGYVDYLIDNYEAYLASLPLSPNRLVVKGINLSVLKKKPFAVKYVSRIIGENIEDAGQKEKAKAKLKKLMEPYGVRIASVLYFNQKLCQLCAEKGWRYFDVNHVISDFVPENGVADRFIGAGFDHHVIDSIEVRRMHLMELIKGVDLGRNIRATV